MAEGYVLLKTETLAWLVERHRTNPNDLELPLEVARDLREALPNVAAPLDDHRIRAAGPLLAVEEHEHLLVEELDLPRAKNAADFWKLVVRIVHAMLQNEAEAVLRVIADRNET
jgi:hypothetical protein